MDANPSSDGGVAVRSYDPAADWPALWACKRAFERELAAGDEAKADRYEGKLTADYRERYRAWVADCVDREPGCVVVCGREAGGSDGPDGEGEGATATGGSAPAVTDPAGGTDAADGAAPAVAGYAFLLPADLAMIWDGAVLNELYLVPELRGTGVADALLDAAVDHARGQDLPLDRLLLDVDPANERARAFYERRGFEPWGEVVARDLT